MSQTILSASRYALPLLGLGIVVICALQLLRRRKIQTVPSAFLLNTINRDCLPLARWENSLGRHKHCDVVLNYPAVSRFHAVIARRRGGWVIIDTGSSGGTLLDGEPVVRRANLHHGQVLRFGSFDLMFCDEEEEARLEREAAQAYYTQ